MFAKLNHLLDSTTKESWAENIFKISKDLGFNRVLYAVTPDKRLPILDTDITTNYSKKWKILLDARPLLKIDSCISHSLNKYTPLVWTQRKKLMKSAMVGVTLPIHGDTFEWGFMSFASNTSDVEKFKSILPAVLPNLSLFRDFAYESGKQYLLSNSVSSPDIKLSKKELNCISWVMEGKSSWEIGVIIGRTENTVNFHLKNIMSKLHVSTRQQAVIKAIRLGLIVRGSKHG